MDVSGPGRLPHVHLLSGCRQPGASRHVLRDRMEHLFCHLVVGLAMEDCLNRDMATLLAYLRKWCLQLSISKTVSAAYYLTAEKQKGNWMCSSTASAWSSSKPQSTSVYAWIGYCPSSTLPYRGNTLNPIGFKIKRLSFSCI